MGNYLKMADKQRVLALLELGWSYRRIERETGIRRETVARYDPRRAPKAATPTAGSVSAGQPYRTIIEAAIARGLTAQRIWQDLREEYGFGYSYSSVKRFVRGLKRSHPEVADVLEILVEDELATRRDRLFARGLKQAGIPEVKTLETYDWSFNPQIPKALILDLATTRFVREHGGLLLLGPPGAGEKGWPSRSKSGR